MNVRLGLVLTTAAIISGTGCAASGGGSGPTAASGTSPMLPSAQTLEEGTRPRDNSHTSSAELYLTQAQTSSDEAEQGQRYRQALTAAQDGIAADPGNPQSYFQAGQAYVGLGDWTNANTMLTKADSIYPRYVLETEAWRERGWANAYNSAIEILLEGDLEGAVEIFEQAAALYPERPEAFLQLGAIYGRLDRYPESVVVFRRAVEILQESKESQMLDTANAGIWEQHWQIASSGLGQSLTFSEQFEEAATLYGELLAENPEDVTIIGSLASVLTELGQPDSVQALYDNLLNRGGLGERDYFNAGVGLYQIENYDRAAEAFERAASMNPFNRDARLNLAQTHYAANAWEPLIPAARALLEVDPLNEIVWIFLARALNETGQAEEANTVFLEYQAIGYSLDQIRLEPNQDGGARITGQMKNTSAEAGSTVTLRFHFGGESGQEIGTLDIRVQMPDMDMFQIFQDEFTSPDFVTGYRYEVIR
ncbi:tetratricopeptide repeat protein [Gemmatimonadota bacterium]